jgi:hypothetical protein
MKTSFDMEMKLTANSSSRVVLPSALAGKRKKKGFTEFTT